MAPARGRGAAGYVVDRLSPAEKQTRQMGRIRYVVLDARNSFYRARLKSFLRAVARHFDQRRPVSLIDLRGFDDGANGIPVFVILTWRRARRPERYT